jgi:hypothetical protein
MMALAARAATRAVLDAARAALVVVRIVRRLWCAEA